MKIDCQAHRSAHVVTLNGELTADEADAFRRGTRELLETGGDVIIDCSGISLIDSVGLESLLWLAGVVRTSSNRLHLAAVPEVVGRVLELTRLATAFTIDKSVESAARSVAKTTARRKTA